MLEVGLCWRVGESRHVAPHEGEIRDPRDLEWSQYAYLAWIKLFMNSAGTIGIPAERCV